MLWFTVFLGLIAIPGCIPSMSQSVQAGYGSTGLVFTCAECICKSKKLSIGLLDFVDCRGSELDALPLFPGQIVSEVCDMSGTPYCKRFDDEDHESTNPQFQLVICESDHLYTTATSSPEFTSAEDVTTYTAVPTVESTSGDKAVAAVETPGGRRTVVIISVVTCVLVVAIVACGIALRCIVVIRRRNQQYRTDQVEMGFSNLPDSFSNPDAWL